MHLQDLHWQRRSGRALVRSAGWGSSSSGRGAGGVRAQDGRRAVDSLLQNPHGGSSDVLRRRRPLSEGTLGGVGADCAGDGPQALRHRTQASAWPPRAGAR